MWEVVMRNKNVEDAFSKACHKKVLQTVDARASGAGGTVEGSDKLRRSTRGP